VWERINFEGNLWNGLFFFLFHGIIAYTTLTALRPTLQTFGNFWSKINQINSENSKEKHFGIGSTISGQELQIFDFSISTAFHN
jgi:hypothetical protein